jgi:hypothetical protein
VLGIGEGVMTDIYQFVRSKLYKHLYFLRGGVKFSTHLSLTTLQPSEFTPIQRLCHTDPRTTPGSINVAALLYLFENLALGGTGFYRWKKEELILQASAMEREAPLKAMPFLLEHFEMFNQPAC